MSIQLMIDVWKSDLDRNCKAVALVYADAASDDGNGIYFSIEYAAWKSGYDHRSITRILRKLEDLGVLLFLGRSESQTKRYKFVADSLPQRPSWKEYREQKTQGGDKMSSPGVTKCPPAPDKMSSNPTYYPTYDNLLIPYGTELEKLSSDTQPESVSPITVSGSGVVKVNSAGALHNVAPVKQIIIPDVEQEIAVILPPNATYPVKVKVQNAPDLATLVAEILPAEPVTVKAKPKKAAAKPKAPKPPKAPHVFTQDELALIAELEAIDPNAASSARSRCGKYRTSDPWSVSQVYLVTNVRVPKVLWSDVAAINGKSFDPKLLLTTFKSWVSGHRQPDNLAWLLEWYKAGGPPARYGQQQQTQLTPAPSKPKIEISDPRVENFAYWIMAQPGYGSKSPRSIQLAAWAVVNGEDQQHLSNAAELYTEYQAAH